MTIIASGISLKDRAEVAFPCSERLFDLLLFVDVDHDPAEVTRDSLLVLYDAAARANPLADRDRPSTWYCISKLQPVSTDRFTA